MNSLHTGLHNHAHAVARFYGDVVVLVVVVVVVVVKQAKPFRLYCPSSSMSRQPTDHLLGVLLHFSSASLSQGLYNEYVIKLEPQWRE